MNRRNFVNSLLLAGASFMILPGAGRVWRAKRKVQKCTWTTTHDSVTLYLTPEQMKQIRHASTYGMSPHRFVRMLMKEDPGLEAVLQYAPGGTYTARVVRFDKPNIQEITPCQAQLYRSQTT